MTIDFRLPDGTVLCGKKHEGEFVEAWRKFVEPIEKATGIKAYGFDPGVAFRSEELGITLELPSWFITRINNALERGESYVEKIPKKRELYDETHWSDWVKK